MNLKERLANLTPEQRALLAERLSQKHAKSGKDDIGLPRILHDLQHRYEPFELTDLQHAYLIGRSHAFDLGNLSSKVYLEIGYTDFDFMRFKNAWRKLIERHEALRLVVNENHQQQILEKTPPWEITLVDLSGKDQATTQAALVEIKHKILTEIRPTDQWPLFDVQVTRLDDRHTRVHLGLDLLNFDAGSVAILMNEMTRFYEHPELALPPLTVSFRDYLASEKTLRETEYYRRSERYWMGRIATIPPGPDLPLARMPSEITGTGIRFTRRTRLIDAARWSRLKQQAAQSGLTPTGIMLAVYSEILGMWSRSQKFTINIPFFNRLPIHPQVEDIIGDFTTVELLEIDRTNPGSFLEKAKRIHRQLLSDLDYRFMDGVKVLRALSQKRGGAFAHGVPVVITSLFDHSYTDSVSRLGKICDSSVNQTSQVWMDLAVDEYEGNLVLKFETVDGLFPDGMLEEMLSAMERLLVLLADNRHNWNAKSLDFFPPKQQKLRTQINDTAQPFAEALLQEFVADVAKSQPDARALVSSKRTLTYGELLRMSTRLGRKLREAGSLPDKPVAIVMEKGWEQIAGVYSVLQAGAPYLPVDPQFPKERIHYLLKNAQVSLVLTQSWVEAATEWPENVRRFCVDSIDLAGVDDRPMAPAQKPNNLAYVLYTSGSTGEPKGVMIEQRSVVNRMLDVNKRHAVTAHDRVIALTALQHDLSVYDMFGPLMAGGTIALPDSDGTRDPAHWLNLVNQEKVTVWNSVPAFMDMFVRHLEDAGHTFQDVSQSLRLVILAGDFIPVTLPDRIRRLFQNAKVISSGGPTETTIWDIDYPIGQVDPNWKSIPYGRPMANASYHILKETLEPCPDWVFGEMYIGGIGLARGYWQDEQRTCDRFITHPQSGERLYRSGDMGRLLPDGNIEIAGRSDFQVKIRGYRVELGEIESALKQNPYVRDAVILAVGESATNKRLVAYVVAKKKEANADDSYDQNDLNVSTANTDSASEKATHSVMDNLKGAPSRLWNAFNLYRQVKPGAAQLRLYFDPIASMEFKMKRHGVRDDDDGRACVQFDMPEGDASLRSIYLGRQSYRHYLQKKVTVKQLGDFLRCLFHLRVDEIPFPKYRYPSPGSLYPVQPYVYVKADRVEDVAEGCYYYHPARHRLVLLTPGKQFQRTHFTSNNFEIFDACAFVIVLMGKMSAIEPLYGDLSRDFCFLEAGYMSQLMMQESPKHELGLCAVGSIVGKKLAEPFLLDESDIFLHALLGGAIDPKQTEVFQVLEGDGGAGVATWSGAGKNAADSLETELADFLKEKLPLYMVPSQFVWLDALPLSPNGKVNRKALPEPDRLEVHSQVALVDPRNDIEQAIARIWKEVLRVEMVGIHSNFFDLGGNSIHVVQVHGKVRQILNKDVPIIEMFNRPTVASLAEYLCPGEVKQDSVAQSRDRAETRRAMRKHRNQSKQRVN